MVRDFEREREVADAIVLERAVRVLKRRYRTAYYTDALFHASVKQIGYIAHELRRGEHDGPGN